MAKKILAPKRTLVVNLFGGPGSGKSTSAAGLFYKLKLAGVNAELVSEYAKERTWLKDFVTLKHQLYVTSKQFIRQSMSSGQVDVIITDSPLLLGCIYRGNGCTKSFDDFILEVYHEFDNYNVFLKRDWSGRYLKVGRNQTKKQAKAVDESMRKFLDKHDIPFDEVLVKGKSTVKNILPEIIKRIK